jgi:F-box/leucine-rich repeat protein 2/20
MSEGKFDIKETVHKNLENKQFPAFTNHRSLIGWCSMNYPKVLVNPIYIHKPD